jgi:hypothetical protein
MPEISHATVYNCLDALVKCGLVRQVTLERGATRFCPNMHEHCHFYCDECGTVFDVDCRERHAASLPRGFKWIITTSPSTASAPDCAKKKMTRNKFYADEHRHRDNREPGQTGIQIRLRHRRGNRVRAAGLERGHHPPDFAKKKEPEWLTDWRLKAYRHWLTMPEPTWQFVKYPKIDFQDITYYSAPKQKGDARKAWMKWTRSCWRLTRSSASRCANAAAGRRGGGRGV